MCFLRQSWTKGWRQIHKFKQNTFFYGMFYGWFFCDFLPKSVKNWLLGGRLGTRHRIQAFWGLSSDLLISKDLNIFFSCVGTKPPHRPKCRGVKILIFFFLVWATALPPPPAAKWVKILIFKSFGNSWGNSYIHFLVIII